MGILDGLLGGAQTQTISNSVDVPNWLQTLLHQGANTASGALSNLSSLSNGNLVAGFNPLQHQAFGVGQDRLNGGGGFFDTAFNQIQSTAQGQPVGSFLPSAASNALSGIAGGNGLSNFIPEQALATLSNGGGGVPSQAMSALSGLSQGVGTPQASLNALNSTANGDFLYGGDGFNAAVDAAVRAATPSIASAFGGTAGGLSGGLARQAIGDTAVNAFASQFGQERQNQLGAANSLANFNLAGANQQASAANALGGLGLAGNQQALSGATVLGQLGAGAQGRQLSAANSLGAFGDAERARQLQAAGALPGLAMSDVNAMLQLGGMQQAQDQQQINAPLAAQQNLLGSSLNSLPISDLLGNTQTQTSQGDPMTSLLGLGLTGASLFATGGMFPGALGGLGSSLGGLGSLFGGGGLGGGGGILPGDYGSPY